ncbi:putative membrane protein [Pseudomonas synxantha BG33R]|uniref:hypothetical protein n=1 Tax=Pseudomonas TaxID=286 RepID=UPI00025FE2BF|nr:MULTISPECIES: hypothetical protein [Pseudomonas]EIK69098.1 putative membrane protein [Pseudomonas synxantha BG33R]MBY8972579.1 hypothetical protein [Pseudomonas sp. P867]MCK3849747.1 hypothetical protein [Pseudomonas sp. W2Jun17]
MKTNKRYAFLAVLAASVLVTLGDTRNIIGSLNYWLLWGGVLVFGIYGSGGRVKLSPEVSSITLGFTLMTLAFMISGVINSDIYTAYQGVKFIAIYILFLVIYSCSGLLELNDFYKIASISIVVSLVVFMLSKFFFTDLYIQLGDGRQGSEFAYPGVMWKVCAFFAPYIIAMLLTTRIKNALFAGLILMASVYILLADSSRTGFLWFAIVVCSFFLLRFLIFPIRTLLVAILCLIAGVCVLLSSNIDLTNHDSLLVLNRLFEGDPVRSAMIQDGISNVQKCFPFGCGFGSSFSVVDGENIVIHNVYLGMLGDVGVLGELALLFLMLMPFVFFLLSLVDGSDLNKNIFFKFAAVLGVLCYIFIMLFHPLSTEMSEWGYWILMVSWLSRIYKYDNAGVVNIMYDKQIGR